MYAVVSTGGKQLKVEEGTEAVVEKLDAEVGDTVALDVLFVADGEEIVADADVLESAKVKAEVVEHFLGEKQVVFKFKRRKGYKRTKGHRQQQTRIKVTGIDAADAKKAAKKPAKKAAPKAEKPAEKPAPAPKAEKKAEKAAPAPEPKVEEKAAAPAPEKKAEAAEEVKMCAATKANGDPCANKAKEGSDYCGVHAKKFDK